MQRIVDPTASVTLPAPPALSGPVGYFQGGPGATRVRYWFLNMLQEELMSLLAAAGIAADTTATVFTQVLAAMRVLFVSAAHMGINGAGTNTGTGNFSASSSFTPNCNGILIANGSAVAVSGGFTAQAFSATGATTINSQSNATAGATNNVGTCYALFGVTSGTPVTVTLAVTGTGGAGSQIGFIYTVNPTS